MELFKLLGTIAISNEVANSEILETTEKAEESSNKITKAFKKIGTAVASYFAVEKIVQFGKNCIQAAADAQAMESQFSLVFGDMNGTAAETLSSIADRAGITENRMKGSFTQIAAFAKTTGMETGDALALSERAMIAVADSAAFYDRSLEETTESLQSFLKGNYENDAALGLSCTEVTRNAAANELYGKSFQELSESQKQLTLLKMVEDANAASGALGQAARESETWTNQTGNLKQAWTDFLALIGGVFLPMAVTVVTKLSEIVTWMTENETVVLLLAIGLGTLTAAIAAYNIVLHASAIATGIMTAATTAFGVVMAFITSPITLVVLAIGALIAIIVLCVQHWDQIKAKVAEVAQNVAEKAEEIRAAIEEKLSAASEAVSSKFEEIKSNISDKINAAKDAVQQAIEAIKGFFDFEWSLPHLKLPHISISGSFSLNPPSAPKFGIEWYRKGGILNDPTIFGLNPFTGNAMVGGEAGAEAIAPIDTLKKYVTDAVNDAGSASLLREIVNILSEFKNSGMPINIDITTELDGAAVARKLYKYNLLEQRNHGTSLINA